MKVDETYKQIPKGNMAGFAAILMWSLSALVIYFSGDVPPMQFVFLAYFLCGTLYLFKWFFLNPDPKSVFTGLRKRDIALVCCGQGFYAALYYYALKTAPILPANLLNYLWPILLVLFTAFIFKTPLKFNHILGLLGGVAGASLILLSGSEGRLNLQFEWGYVFALGGAVVWAVYSTLTRRIHFAPDAMVFPLYFTSLLCFVLFLLFEEWHQPTAFETGVIVVAGVMAVSYALWDYSMKRADIQLIASLSYFIPLMSTLWLLFFTEKDGLGLSVWIGGALIIGGCLLTNYQRIIAFLKK